MGTSKGYGMPTGGAWTPLKNEASRFAKEVGGGSGVSVGVSPGRLVGNYIAALGGSGDISRGRGGSSGASVGRTGQSAIRTGRALGGFFSGVASQGLSEALKAIGLSHLIGQSAAEVAGGLLDAFAGPASTLDDQAVRTALSDLYSEILESAETSDDVEKILSDIVNKEGVAKILANFFGKYLYRLFITSFYETWQKKVGAAQAKQKLREIKDYISSHLKNKFADDNATKIDWAGAEGQRITQRIMKNTLDIFGVTS
jgi:hypothetical protein